jgi:thiol-disulfide isomerase/thioredoxin
LIKQLKILEVLLSLLITRRRGVDRAKVRYSYLVSLFPAISEYLFVSCVVIAPKFEELSEKYPDAVFLKVIGDASPEASKLMKREGVRSVPSFHYFMNGEKVDVINGANAEAIEAAIAKLAHSAA